MINEDTRRKLSDSHTGKVGDKASNWKGGRKYNAEGYVLIYCSTHPNNSKGYVYEHRLVMEAHLGRTLLSTEICHHINGIKDDNRIENLMLFATHREHCKYEGELLRLAKRGNF